MPTRKRRNQPAEQFPEILRLLGIIQTRRKKQNETTSTDSSADALAIAREWRQIALEEAERTERVFKLLKQTAHQLKRVDDIWGKREDQAEAIIKELLSDAKANYRTYRSMRAREAKHWLGLHKGGKEATKSRKADANARHERIRQRASKLLQGGMDFRNLSGHLAPEYGLSTQQMRTILRPLKPKEKKRK